MKKYLLILVLMLTILYSGCQQMTAREALTNAGYDINYIDGYVDGRSSGFVAAGHPWYKFKKDIYRYEKSFQYKQGWNDGFMIAKGQYESIQRMF